MWQHPHPIDVTATRDVPTPDSWQAALPGQATVATLSLSDDTELRVPGWCTDGAEMQGPEIEVVCGGINTKQPTHVGVWRQGNLLHFGFEPSPSQLNATGRKLLLNGIDYIARFVTDRPIVRVRTFFDTNGSGPSVPWLQRFLADDNATAENLAGLFAEPWRTQIAALDDDAAHEFVNTRLGALVTADRKFAFDRLAVDLGLDLRLPEVLPRLVGQLATEHRDAASALLRTLLPDGPGPDTAAANWGNWLRARQRYLCRDPFALVFRLDPVAQWRGEDSGNLRGPQRADGQSERDPAAMALAAKILAFHGGGRALDDLQTFSCRNGDVHYLWDRRAGVLRIENDGTLPQDARATPWRVILFDTCADDDILMGGGPAPRPRVSGRGMFRVLVERLFLPLLLQDPGTSLELRGEDDDGNQRLAVKIAGRGLDPRKTHVLIVAPSGQVVAYDLGASAASRTNVMQITATTQVGPLLLPTSFSQTGRIGREYVYTDATWNPRVPAGAAESSELLLNGK